MSKFLILVLLLDTILNLQSLFKITRSDFLTLFLRSKLSTSNFQSPAVMLNSIQHLILLFPTSNFQTPNSNFQIPTSKN